MGWLSKLNLRTPKASDKEGKDSEPAVLNKEQLKEAIIEVIHTIYDPEIPVDIYELGLIYEINVSDNYDVEVIMTLTSPNCPAAVQLPEEVKQKTAGVSGVKEVTLELVFDPPWHYDMMSEEAKLELGFL